MNVSTPSSPVTRPSSLQPASKAVTADEARGEGPAARPAADRFEPAARTLPNLLPSAPAGGQHLFGGLDLGDVAGDALDLLRGPSAKEIGWMEKANLPPTKDITADFREAYQATRIGADVLPDEAKDYVYLTVDGLTGENWPGYMEANREGLRDRGLDVREIKVDTEASTLTNAETIRKAIESVAAEGKQVVLIGHSKGGVDSTAALALHPELKEHVRAVVTMQSPYGGAPLATDLLSNGVTKWGVDMLAKHLFKGDPKTVRDLTYDYRQQFIADHPYPTDIPTVSLATSSESQLSLVAAPNNYTRLRYGEKTDGLVSPRDGYVPGSNVVKLDDLDHVNSTMPNIPQLSKWEPGDLTVALVAMALKHPPAAQAQALPEAA